MNRKAVVEFETDFNGNLRLTGIRALQKGGGVSAMKSIIRNAKNQGLAITGHVEAFGNTDPGSPRLSQSRLRKFYEKLGGEINEFDKVVFNKEFLKASKSVRIKKGPIKLKGFKTPETAIREGQHGSVVERGIRIDENLADELNLPAASAAYFDPGFGAGSYVGKIAFPMMADRMRTGTYTSRSGKIFELRGGPDHPDIPINQGKVAWASMGGPQTTQLQNAINRTDGIGLVVLMDEMAVASNRTYARIMIEELKYDMANNPDAAAIMPEQIAEAAKAVRKWARESPQPKKKFLISISRLLPILRLFTKV